VSKYKKKSQRNNASPILKRVSALALLATGPQRASQRHPPRPRSCIIIITRVFEFEDMDRPRCYSPLALHLLLCLVSLRACSAASITAGTPDESELWGYVEVRPST
jgi:hypothetical protein